MFIGICPSLSLAGIPVHPEISTFIVPVPENLDPSVFTGVYSSSLGWKS